MKDKTIPRTVEAIIQCDDIFKMLKVNQCQTKIKQICLSKMKA